VSYETSQRFSVVVGDCLRVGETIDEMVHIYKPEFVKHDGGSPIFSVDCHPDGTRLATAGGDQKVKVWNLSSIKDRAVEGDPNVPQILATLSEHFNTVNCVRFSKNGQFLASGSTDTNVFLYEKRPGPGRAAFGSSDAPNVENWVSCQTLRGHLSDVIDLSWAPDDSMLASCSLDNLVIVWDPRLGQKVQTLKGHTSFVKGVSWDPIGKYLCTQADDKSVIVWRVDDWSVVSKITEPYQSSMGNTFSMRLDWSPDGKAVTTCNSYKKPSHTASVLERGDWGSKFDFVGHKGPVVTVRFSPALFKPSDKDENGKVCKKLTAAARDATPHTVIACGSQDCKMTVWATNRPKPVCIVKTCFTQSVVDTCWSPDGYSLIACSTDGTVAVFTFDASELGCAMTDTETRAFLSKEYGDLRRRVGPILEDPSLLKFKPPPATTPTKSPLPPARTPAVANAPPEAAQHTKAPKRVAPQVVGNGNAVVENSSVVTDPVAGAGAGPVAKTVPGAPTTAPTAQAQRETVGNDGRRRIMPVPQGGGFVSAAAAPSFAPTNSPLGKRRLEPTPMNDNGKRVQVNAMGGFGAGDSRGGDSRGASQHGFAQHTHHGAPPGRGHTTVMMLAPGAAGAAAMPTASAPATLHCQLESGDADPFAAVVESEGGGRETSARRGPTMLEARNAEKHCDVVCSSGGVARWSDRCSDSRATHIVGSAEFAAVFFENGTTQLYTPAGRRAMPPLVLPGKVAFVSARGGRLVAVCGDCSLIVWELGVPGEERQTMRESVAPLLIGPRAPPAPAMVGVRLSVSGAPIAQFADGHAYVFQHRLKAWARVADHSFPRSEFTTRLRLPPGAGGGGTGGELHALQVAAARAAVGMGPSALLQGGANAPAPRKETGRHLECLLASAEILGSKNEYRTWLRAYVRHLAAEGADEQAQVPLRELCVSLLGPLSGAVVVLPVEGSEEIDGEGDTNAGRWVPTIAGAEKRTLLREVVLPALAANRATQRLVPEFDEMLAVAEHRAAAANAK
jgi:protein HIRA/HIR1